MNADQTGCRWSGIRCSRDFRERFAAAALPEFPAVADVVAVAAPPAAVCAANGRGSGGIEERGLGREEREGGGFAVTSRVTSALHWVLRNTPGKSPDPCPDRCLRTRSRPFVLTSASRASFGECH